MFSMHFSCSSFGFGLGRSGRTKQSCRGVRGDELDQVGLMMIMKKKGRRKEEKGKIKGGKVKGGVKEEIRWACSADAPDRGKAAPDWKK